MFRFDRRGLTTLKYKLVNLLSYREVCKAMNGEALGMIKRKGWWSYRAADAMVKAANVRLIGYEKIGSGLVIAMVRGDVGQSKLQPMLVQPQQNVGEIVSVHVIPRPHSDTEKLLPKLG